MAYRILVKRKGKLLYKEQVLTKTKKQAVEFAKQYRSFPKTKSVKIQKIKWK